MFSSRDGYCTIVVFDDIMPAHTTQQHALQLQALTGQHTMSAMPTPLGTPMLVPATGLPPPPPVPALSAKRREPSVTPSAGAEDTATVDKAPEPPKKKRRVALTRVGDVGS
jgi:chromatin assembly factor 1 subunit B